MIVLLIFWSLSVSTSISDDVSSCNDECLLSKFKINTKINAKTNTHIILPYYDKSNNLYKDTALIWTDPCKYFSDAFLRALTNKRNPTNKDFRKAFYHRYIKADNLSLILQINANTPNDIDIEYFQNMMAKYKLDGYVYNVKNSIDPIARHNRALLNTDILNQRTWDPYDWFLYAFSILSFGSCCLCCGCCIHKKCIAEEILHIEDIDHRKVATTANSPIHDNNGMLFTDTNTLNDKIDSGNDQCNEYNRQMQKNVCNNNDNATKLQFVTTHMSINTPIQPIKVGTDNTMVKMTSIDVVGSPDSDEPSQSHLSVDIFVKRINSTGSDIQCIEYTPENSINKASNGDDIDNICENNESSDVPLRKMQSVKSNGLDVIDEVDEHIQGTSYSDRIASALQINK